MKITTPRFLYLLTACMLLISAIGLRADTVVTDPKGKTLQFGRSTVNVSFSATNFDPELKDLEWNNSKCLIMGMIDGRIVVANTDQTRPATKNKLFYVTLLGDGIAHFSGLIEDQIQVTGATPLSRYVKHEDPVITVTNMHNQKLNFYNPYSRGQLLQWNGVNRDGTPARYVFMIDGYQREIDVFTLKDATLPGEPIGVQEIAFTRKLLLPGKYGVEGYEINALDCIDLNAFRDTTSASATNAPTDPLPRALMIWCKPQGKTGYKDVQLVLPTDVLTCSVNTAVTSIQINAGESRPFDPFQEDKNSDDIDNVIGGCVTAPDEKGNLCYWFSDLRVEHRSYHGDFYVRINKKEISNPPRAGYLTTKPSTRTCEYHYYYGGEWAKQYYWDEFALNNPGLKVVIATNDDKSVSIVAGISREKYGPLQSYDAKKIKGNEFIGICDAVSPEEVNQINKSTRIIGGAIPSDLTERLKRVAVVEGYTVLRVFLGQPYVAAPNMNDPTINTDIFKNCSYKYNYTSSSLYQNSFNNGTSSKLETGIAAEGRWGLSKAEFGVSSSYESDYNKETNTGITIGANIQEVASTADSFSLGSIVYTKIQPKIYSMARVVPSKQSKQLTVLGDTNAYQLLMMNTSPKQASDQGAKISIQRFSVTNPALVMEGMNGQPGKEYHDAADRTTNKTNSFTTPYSVLSDGLLPRPFSSLISCTNTNGFSSLPTVVMNAHKQITAWEATNNLIADIQQFNSTNGGVSAYFETIQKGEKMPTTDGSVDLGYNLTATYSILNKTETIVTRAHKWSAGFYWNTVAVIFATKGEVNYNRGVMEVNTDSETNQFEIGIGGWDQAPNIIRSYYYYWIDVPSIKSYMASHPYKLQSGENKGSYTNEVHRPAFIPAYCWLHNQSFMLGVPWLKPGVNSAQPTR